MKLVQVVRGLNTSDETVATLKEVSEVLRKEVVEVKKDVPGFIVNRIMIPQFIEAIKVLEEGIASKEDIDKAMRYGLNYRMGSFELQDYEVLISVTMLWNTSKKNSLTTAGFTTDY